MSFEILELSCGSEIVERHSLKLAGHNFIYRTWEALGSPTGGWVAQGAFIEKMLRQSTSTNNSLKILISTMNYEFFVEEIWGWTYIDAQAQVTWTPLLFVGKEISQMNGSVKIQFNNLYQFMYLQGESSGWIFGSGGPNTSPLLFDDTFDWFRRAIKKRNYNVQPIVPGDALQVARP